MATLAILVYRKTKLKMNDYCEMRGLDKKAFGSGYVSRRHAEIFEADGIEWQKASNVRVAGGSSGRIVNIKEAKDVRLGRISIEQARIKREKEKKEKRLKELNEKIEQIKNELKEIEELEVRDETKSA